jgi:LysM repeat protein
MTVFIAVLALHVVVIGGFTVYHLMSGGSSDADLLTDKTHKGVKVTSEGALPGDNATPDASQTASTAPTDTNAAPVTPAPETATTTETTQTPVATTTIVNPTTSVHQGPVITPAQNSVPMVASPGPDLTQTQSAPPVTINGSAYVVKPHDSLARIAHQHGTTVAKLKSANHLNSDLLHIGQKLVIPSKGQSQVAATTEATPTILNDGPAPSLAPAATTLASTASEPVATAHGHIYTVVKGDTLTKIAHKFKTTPTAIMTANNLSDPTKLSIGKKLKIPAREDRSATTAPAATPVQPTQDQGKSGTTAQLANFVQ